MRSSAILLIPALIPLICVIHTSVTQSSYDLLTCHQKRQVDFIIHEGNLHFTSYQKVKGDNAIDFNLTENWQKRASIYPALFLGDAPAFQIFPAGRNTPVVPGGNIISAQIPVWIISILLAIPFLVYILRRKGIYPVREKK